MKPSPRALHGIKIATGFYFILFYFSRDAQWVLVKYLPSITGKKIKININGVKLYTNGKAHEIIKVPS
jgi:hypothetical protein